MSEGVEPWLPDDPGVLVLPSGRLVRGRGLRHPLPGGSLPTYAPTCDEAAAVRRPSSSTSSGDAVVGLEAAHHA